MPRHSLYGATFTQLCKILFLNKLLRLSIKLTEQKYCFIKVMPSNLCKKMIFKEKNVYTVITVYLKYS